MDREEIVSGIVEAIAEKAIEQLLGNGWSMKGNVIKWPGVVCTGNAVPPPDADEMHITVIAKTENPDADERIVKFRVDSIAGRKVSVLAQGVVPAGESDKAWERCHNACITVAMLEKFLKES